MKRFKFWMITMFIMGGISILFILLSSLFCNKISWFLCEFFSGVGVFSFLTFIVLGGILWSAEDTNPILNEKKEVKNGS